MRCPAILAAATLAIAGAAESRWDLKPGGAPVRFANASQDADADGWLTLTPDS